LIAIVVYEGDTVQYWR